MNKGPSSRRKRWRFGLSGAAPAFAFALACFASAPRPHGARAEPPAIGAATKESGPRTLEDYRHFRALSIDLLGRMPTRDELAAFERPSFDLNGWTEQALKGAAYSERMTRMMMDLLRLEPNVNFAPAPSQLYRHAFPGPDGKPVWIYFRENQRRSRPETDGEFCLSPDETGVVVRPRAQPLGSPKKLSQRDLDRYTVRVRPWWLYRDYKEREPVERYGTGGAAPDPAFELVDTLRVDDEGHPVADVRVCREEAQTQATGHLYARVLAGKGPPLPGGRLRPIPVDRPYAIAHVGEEVACSGKLAAESTVDCGCGPGLERCLPGDNDGTPSAFMFPKHVPLGEDEPLDDARQQAQRWFPYWWSREAVRFLEDVFAEDRDYREILSGHQTRINGPLAQFYRTIQSGNCCGSEVTFGMRTETEPLFDPESVPTDLGPADASTWRTVADRGQHASGILTMPIFLEKYASARARGAILHTAFLCKAFVADAQALMPSTEPNLMVRPGCRTCHETLEPLAAYFARIEPSSFVFLPASTFPIRNPTCRPDRAGRLSGGCNAIYDAAFATAGGPLLRSAYGSPEHADATPSGAARDVTAQPEFATCAAQHVASSFFGRQLGPDDAGAIADAAREFVRSGYRMRTLVRAVLASGAYRQANNESPDDWRRSLPSGAAGPSAGAGGAR